MSVLGSPLATPSRVRGAFRYLISKTGQRESHKTLQRVLSPESLLRDGNAETKKRTMVNETIGECVKMGLLIEQAESDGLVVAINPELSSEARSKSKGDELLPQTLAGLMLSTERLANEDLATVIAWYLCQDAYGAPGKWEGVQAALLQQVGADLLGMNNDVRYNQFEDWICFLGLAWKHNLKDKDLLTPDPTAFLRCALPSLIAQRGGQPSPLGEFVVKLASHCPVFETGSYRTDVENKVGTRETEQHLSSTTSLALLRLRDERLIELSKRSDAAVFTLPDGNRIQSFSHIQRN